MSKKNIGAVTAISPIPAFIATVADKDGNSNLITISYGGIVNAIPPMVYMSVRDTRCSYRMLKETGEFVINIPGENLTKETDLCGILSASKVDKWETTRLTRIPASIVKVPMVKECPVNIECVTKHVIALGSHDIFIAEVVATHADEDVLSENNKIMIEKFKPFAFCYNAQEYWTLNGLIGHYGWTAKVSE
jgi:flavin reductase (DIM6/NTAB) family NADH-FMN oxidoreductase RutF